VLRSADVWRLYDWLVLGLWLVSGIFRALRLLNLTFEFATEHDKHYYEVCGIYLASDFVLNTSIPLSFRFLVSTR
jgi:hypothetical protein